MSGTGGKARLRRRRKRLHEEDPRCHWCGVETVLPEGPCPPGGLPPDTATIDHVKSKLHPERGKDASINTVLACHACNKRRNQEEIRGEFREEFLSRARGGQPRGYELDTPVLETAPEWKMKLAREFPRNE